MIQQNYQNNVKEVSGQVVTTGFNIEVNESMFAMLTSNIYSDPILANMREWSTNACDACIAADLEVKFDVHLPKLSEPYFFVRDYGTGLAPEDITGLFSNLGASTKRNSDSYNGTLGIGRMAGLAVADAFTVDSYFNGNHYSYAISMQNGVPVTLSLGEQLTTEPNGLKLSVLVDLDDIQSYVSKTKELYSFFDYKPTLNYDNIDVELDCEEHISEDWFKYDSGDRYDSTNYVVMSQIAYAIPFNDKVETYRLTNLVIKAPPGAVTFNPGRESLSLNKETIAYLNKMFKKISEDYVLSATMALAECSSDKDIMAKYTTVTNDVPYNIGNQIDPIPFTSDNYKLLAASAYRRSSALVKTYVATTPEFTTFMEDKVQVVIKSRHYKTLRLLNSNNTITHEQFFTAIHVVVDLKTKYKSVICNKYAHENLICWQRIGKTDVDEAAQKSKDYLDAMGVEYILASTIVAEETANNPAVAVKTREGLYARMYHPKVPALSASVKYSADDAANATYLYLKLNNTEPVISDTSISMYEYNTMYNFLRQADSMPNVMGVSKKYQSIVDDLDNWIDFETYIKEKAKDFEFRIPSTTRVPRLLDRLINQDSVVKYPKDIQDYFTEVSNYHEFNEASNYVSNFDDIKMIKAKFGATTTTFVPSKDIDMDSLLSIYPQTVPLLSNQHIDSRHVSNQLVTHIAMLEEIHAIHRT